MPLGTLVDWGLFTTNLSSEFTQGIVAVLSIVGLLVAIHLAFKAIRKFLGVG